MDCLEVYFQPVHGFICQITMNFEEVDPEYHFEPPSPSLSLDLQGGESNWPKLTILIFPPITAMCAYSQLLTFVG